MPVTVYRIPDEPIIIATFKDVVTAAIMQQMYDESAHLIEDDEPHVIYRITDFRNVVTAPEQVLQILHTARSRQGASTTDARIRPVLVGDNEWSQLASDLMWQTERVDLPIFESIADALQHIRIILYRSGSARVS